MIFQSIVKSDERLQPVIDEIETSEIGLRVVSVSAYKVPCVKLTVNFTVQKARQFNILEEFVLRAAADFKPAPTRSEISIVLGLDPIFVASTCQELTSLGVIKKDEGDVVELTQVGREYYNKKSIPEPPQERSLSLNYDCITKTILMPYRNASSEGDEPSLTSFLKLNLPKEEQTASAQESVTLSSFIQATQVAGMGIHRPSEGQQITNITSVSVDAEEHYTCAVALVHDTLKAADQEDNLSVHAYNPQPVLRNLKLEKVIVRHLVESRQKITDLLPADDESLSVMQADPPVPPPNYVSLARSEYISKQQAAKTLASGIQTEDAADDLKSRKSEGPEILRDQDIRPKFLTTLKNVDYKLLIFSPWMNDQVLDASFCQQLNDLAQRGAFVLLGWGIARTRENEKKPPSERLLTVLQDIKNLRGVPAVNVWWLGNHHAKEVIADDRVWLSGSHNWLSYRGDRYLRGESVYCFNQPNLIAQAQEYWFPKFALAAQIAWDNAFNSASLNIDNLIRCCVTWITVKEAAWAYEQLHKSMSSVMMPFDKGMGVLNAINSTLGLCAHQDYKSQDVPSLIENHFVQFVELARVTQKPTDSVHRVAASFKPLLRRNADLDKARVSQFVKQNSAMLIDAGWLTNDKTLDEVVDEIIKPAAKPKDKKNKKGK